MTAISQAKATIQIEETISGAAPSEAILQKIGGSINWLNANAGTQLGDIIQSGLTEVQFQSLRGNNWVRMAGQSVAGSDYATLTGVTTLPNISKGEGLLVSTNPTVNFERPYEETSIFPPAITRIFYGPSHLGDGNKYATAPATDSPDGLACYAVNHFIKINNNPT